MNILEKISFPFIEHYKYNAKVLLKSTSQELLIIKVLKGQDTKLVSLSSNAIIHHRTRGMHFVFDLL